jgi:hypothetical protein
MTEPGWLSSTDPAPMLEFLQGKARDRKLILAVVAACWLRCAGEPHTLFGTEIEVCDRYADRVATPAELYQLINRFHAGVDSINPDSTDRNTRDGGRAMSEEEWLGNASPGLMLRFLGVRASGRKLSLFNCHCVEFTWQSLLNREIPSHIELAWAAADGLIGKSELANIAPPPTGNQPMELEEPYAS